MRSILFVVISLCLLMGVPVCLAAELDLVSLYAETGANLLETEFQAWLRMAPTYNEAPVGKLLEQVAAKFGYQFTGSVQESSFQENFQQAFALVDFFEAEGWLTIQRMQNYALTTEVETFIGLRAVRQGAWPSLQHYRERVLSEFDSLGERSDIQFFTTLIGTYPGRLAAQTRQTVVNQIQALAEATPVETFTEGELTTFSFLSPHLPDRLQVGPNQMNLHLAFRYNEFENQTYVYLGNPIIAPDY